VQQQDAAVQQAAASQAAGEEHATDEGRATGSHAGGGLFLAGAADSQVSCCYHPQGLIDALYTDATDGAMVFVRVAVDSLRASILFRQAQSC
jgi:hypothetical protein